MAMKCKINIAYTVPYSPQTNIPAENYFSQMKYVACYKFNAVINEQNPENLQPRQHVFDAYKDHILKQWDEQTLNFYGRLASAKNIWSMA